MLKNLFSVLFVFIAFSSHAQLISDGLQAHYTFDNNLQDVTTNGNELVAFGNNLNYHSIHQNDYGIDFTSNPALTTPNNFNTSNYNSTAISLWIKTSQTKFENQTILQGAYMGIGIHIEANTGKIGGFFNGTSAGAYSSTNAVTDGNWHHIVFQCDGSEMFVYIDGVLDGSIPSTMLTGDNKLYIGNSNQGNKSYDGAINELRIYDRMLTDCEITELHRQMVATIDASNGISVAADKLIVQNKACDPTIHFKVYPNPPLDNNFVLEFEAIEQIRFITITDATGQTVQQKIPNGNSRMELNVQGLKGGLYYITIYGINDVETIQMLKP